jgi:Tol biopolymer transport system component
LTDASLAASFPSVSPRAGSIVFASRYLDSNIWRIDLTGQAAPQRVIASDLLDSTPQYSPDGSKITFRSNRTGDDEIWMADADGKSPVRLTDFKGPVTGSARWSADGKYLVFDSRPNGNSDILLIPAGGGGMRQITYDASNDALPHFSGDGKSVFFTSNRTGTWQIWKQSLDGGAAQQITRDGGFASQESADHQWLYYSKADAKGLFRMPLGGGEERCVLPSLPAESWGAWALAGDRVVYFSQADDGKRGDPVELRTLDLLTGKSIRVTTTQFPPVRWDGALAISPDGRSALVALIEREGSEIHLQSEP